MVILNIFSCAICHLYSSLVNCSCLCPFSSWIIHFLLLSIEISLHLRYQFFVGYVVCKYLLPAFKFFFHPLYWSFKEQPFLILTRTNLWIVLLVSSLKTPRLALDPKDFLLSFSPKNVTILHFTFKSITHVELIFG